MITTRCHSVCSLRSPLALSFQLSEVATVKLTIFIPDCALRISGSFPRFPTNVTLFTLPAISRSFILRVNFALQLPLSKPVILPIRWPSHKLNHYPAKLN